MRELKLSYPLDRKVDILTKDQELCKKAHAKNKEREKEDKFYEITNDYKKYLIFVANDKNVQETIKKHLNLINNRSLNIHKIKI